jgi:hypothetical protein
VCGGGRFFLTENGELGIGHSKTRPGDLICALFGADVPYILRKSNHESDWTIFHGGLCRYSSPCLRQRHLDCCLPPLHRLVGQAYVNGKMQYSGNLLGDAERGVIDLEVFGIE